MKTGKGKVTGFVTVDSFRGRVVMTVTDNTTKPARATTVYMTKADAKNLAKSLQLYAWAK